MNASEDDEYYVDADVTPSRNLIVDDMAGKDDTKERENRDC